jgi:hypothetical protein
MRLQFEFMRKPLKTGLVRLRYELKFDPVWGVERCVVAVPIRQRKGVGASTHTLGLLVCRVYVHLFRRTRLTVIAK